MARYNTVAQIATATTTSTISVPGQGLFTQFTGTAPYTVTIPDPTLYYGQTQTFYNATSGVITIATPNGLFKGPASSGLNTQSIPPTTTISLASDGTNYVIVSEDGGPLVATTGTFSSTITANSSVAFSPFNANVVMSPTGTGVVTIAPTAVGTIDNMTIGGTTRAAGSFTTLAANSTLSLSATSATHTISSTTNVTAISGQSLTLSGGLGVTGNIYNGGNIICSASTPNTGASSGALQVTGGGYVGGNFYIGGILTEASSIKLKENVSPIVNALDKVLQLNGVTYDRIDGSSTDESGLIAEEVFKVIPSLVTKDANGNVNGVQYSKLTAYLVESIKQLTLEINKLKGNI